FLANRPHSSHPSGMSAVVAVVSDLHLFDRAGAFVFNEHKERAFLRLAEAVRERDGRLVLAGDIFDLTGLTPCRSGMEEFFRECVPAERLDPDVIRRSGRVRGTAELLIAIRE